MLELLLVPFLEATIRTATPLAFAALGELVSERAGVINLGMEGAIIAGCLGGAAAALAGGSGIGYLGAAAAGLALASVFAFFVVRVGSDQIITGTAITVLGLGVTGTVFHLAPTLVGVGAALPTTGPIALPILSHIPVVGRVLFTQPAPTYALYVLVPLVAWWMRHTHAGLALRAVGESPAAAAAAGVAAGRVRALAIAFSGAMGGLCGGTLVLAQVGSFNENMSAGRGFIAIAIVVLGRWTPWGTAGAALVFGAAFALQYLVQSLGLALPYQLFLAMPYVLTLVLLATQRGRAVAPAHLGR
ncbi:ABC transporter permease [Pseudogemmatithrix spongiicola]|uniref:ABC transporter permease n=1 Tax=Pseudogemmatithrix spongiicola TaxID=3062599 RepID=A0AA49K2F3_9BACT|nr:ABC transporter permease [Gemmatimonadaceae bacterium 'strain 138']WKW16552.1 ABC transporter permease [Gemmatimonadaceae bacterium 'strain 318']